MPAKDIIHDAVKNALIKDGWKITHDPYTIKYEEVTAYADLGAEFIFSAEKESCKIVVEVKSFINSSPLTDLKVALGQFEIYKTFLKITAPEHQLYIAISHKAYDEIFQQKAYQLVIKEYKIPLLIVNVETEEILKWIKPSNIAT
ncbi:element excision factor XisH family protein [Candidatus Parabeggiatoa sp. HSG14]|uniref:element excision factor XisH family protein n=1 Tax=Candidatus Parabeggiatoa sp. HSG14 TaxID=3055593 RepID=UPI0025A92C4F|nr:element excision factor XisH family protein [Thiotrichales bacterium HSG14]